MPNRTPTLQRPPAPIDPRIRARRIEVRRGRGRRRRQRLVDLGLLLAVGAGFAGALRSPLLDVDRVRLEGNRHTPAEVVLDRSGIQVGDQLADLDLRAAGERVAQLPWIDDVRIRRGLDGLVEVRITERSPVAVVGDGPDAVLVDREGRGLALSADEPELSARLPRLETGPGALEPGEFLSPAGQGALALAARLSTLAPGLPIAVSVEEPLVATLGTGAEVHFGPATQLDAKVRSLRTVLEQVDLTCAALIDVRSPGSPVLTREEGCS